MPPLTIDRLHEQRDISDRTKYEYYDVLRRTLGGMNKTIEWVILHPNSTVHWYVNNISMSTSARLMLANAVVKMTKIYAQYSAKHLEPVQRWAEIVKECNKEIRNKYKTHEMDEKKQDNMVMYNELKDKYCELSKNPSTMTRSLTSHMEYILFTMLLSIRPKRADLGCVYLSVDTSVPEDKLKGNYISISGNTGKLHLNRYKTDKTYGTIEESLPVATVKLIRKSLEILPRDYLIINNRRNPYNNKTYSKFFTRACEHHFDKAMSASLWRVVFVGENVDFNVDPLVLEENARLMGHSSAMQMNVYRKLHKYIERRENPKVTPVCPGQKA